jgi:hypothetical protein
MAFSLSAPKKPVWLVATILGVLGIVGHFVSIPVVTPHQFWFVTAGFAILGVATLMKGI